MTIDTKAALKHFKATDNTMANLLEFALKGPTPLTLPTPKKPSEYFASIASSVVSQQISTHAARAIKARVVEALGGSITPQSITTIDFMTLKSCGLSEKKTQYLKHNAEIWHQIPIEQFSIMTEEEIIKELTKLYGIGRWTAEMFLMFSLARADVFSFGDLALVQSLYKHYNLKPHFNRKILSTVETWSPHRTIASLTLWHTKDSN
jgi:DNA-3-methyladenine glycosylase II